MLDAVLTGIGGFGGSDGIGHVANKHNVFAICGLRNREVRLAAQRRLHFDEVNTARDELTDSFVGLRAIGNNERWLERGRSAIEIRAGSENARDEMLPFFNFHT